MHRFAAAILFALVVIVNSAPAQEAPPTERPVEPATIERLAKLAEPDLHGRPTHVRQYVETFRFNSANDARLCVFDVAAEPAGEKGVRLTGFVEFPETRAALAAYFKKLGFAPVENQLETLPAKSLGDKRFGFIKTNHGLSYVDLEQSEIGTDCLLGEPLFLLRLDGDRYYAHNGDGYLGYIDAKDVLPVDEATFAKYLAGPRVSVRKDQAKANGVALLAGSRPKFLRTEGDHHVAQLPTGEEVKIPVAESDLRDSPAEQLDVVCTNAKQLLGTKYLWGGKTSDGVDCSGLVQVAYGNAGVRLPRDSTQQIHMGQLTGTRWSRAAMRRGDTLYFLNPQGRISHTGLYLGDDQYIHAVSPVVRINSFNPEDENYDLPRHASFAFARRLWE
jgi:cell wall-associated NlpC family hydrolase